MKFGQDYLLTKLILMYMDDEDTRNAHYINKLTWKICKTQSFWQEKLFHINPEFSRHTLTDCWFQNYSRYYRSTLFKPFYFQKNGQNKQTFYFDPFEPHQSRILQISSCSSTYFNQIHRIFLQVDGILIKTSPKSTYPHKNNIYIPHLPISDCFIPLENKVSQLYSNKILYKTGQVWKIKYDNGNIFKKSRFYFKFIPSPTKIKKLSDRYAIGISGEILLKSHNQYNYLLTVSDVVETLSPYWNDDKFVPIWILHSTGELSLYDPESQKDNLKELGIITIPHLKNIIQIIRTPHYVDDNKSEFPYGSIIALTSLSELFIIYPNQHFKQIIIPEIVKPILKIYSTYTNIWIVTEDFILYQLHNMSNDWIMFIPEHRYFGTDFLNLEDIRFDHPIYGIGQSSTPYQEFLNFKISDYQVIVKDTLGNSLIQYQINNLIKNTWVFLHNDNFYPPLKYLGCLDLINNKNKNLIESMVSQMDKNMVKKELLCLYPDKKLYYVVVQDDVIYATRYIFTN